MDIPASPPLGRNELCHCQSGKKYKQCCLSKDEAAAREAREKARASAQAAAEAEAAEAPGKEDHPATARPPKHDQSAARGGTSSRGYQKTTGTRRKV